MREASRLKLKLKRLEMQVLGSAGGRSSCEREWVGSEGLPRLQDG